VQIAEFFKLYFGFAPGFAEYVGAAAKAHAQTQTGCLGVKEQAPGIALIKAGIEFLAGMSIAVRG
jgi:hypothetical protein